MQTMADLFEQAAAYLERDPGADQTAVLAALPQVARCGNPFVRDAIIAIVPPTRVRTGQSRAWLRPVASAAP